jgi:hypothetical protein
MTQTRYLMIIVSGGASDRFLGGPGKVQKIFFQNWKPCRASPWEIMSCFSSLTRRLSRASWDVFIVRKRINRLVFFSVWSASTNGLGLAKNYERATARLGPNVASPVIILTRQKDVRPCRAR